MKKWFSNHRIAIVTFVLFITTYLIAVAICADSIDFSYYRDINITIAKFYFLKLPLWALIPSLLYLCTVVAKKYIENRKENNGITHNIFCPFPFSEISTTDVLGISLGMTYPDVILKLNELQLLSDKWKTDALAIYKQFPDVTLNTDKMNIPFMGVKNMSFVFAKYKLESICIYLSDSNRTKEKYEELKELFIKKFNNKPATYNEIIYWKYESSILSIDTDKGIVSLQIAK